MDGDCSRGRLQARSSSARTGELSLSGSLPNTRTIRPRRRREPFLPTVYRHPVDAFLPASFSRSPELQRPQIVTADAPDLRLRCRAYAPVPDGRTRGRRLFPLPAESPDIRPPSERSVKVSMGERSRSSAVQRPLPQHAGADKVLRAYPDLGQPHTSISCGGHFPKISR